MLHISTRASTQHAATEAVRELAGYGFERLEITGPADFDAFDEHGLADLVKEHELHILLHGHVPPQPEPFVPNPATAGPDEQHKLVALADQAVRLSQALGQNLYSLDAGYAWEVADELDEAGRPVPVAPIQAPYAQMDEALTSLAKRLPDGFRLAVANGEPAEDGSPMSLAASPEQIIDFLDWAAGLPGLGLLLDMGRLARTADALCFDRWEVLDQLVSAAPELILKVRLSPDTLHGGDAELDFLREVRGELDGVPLVLDWPGCDPHQAVRRAAEIRDRLGTD
jgi:sugar phosphate isomerase/epimerase